MSTKTKYSSARLEKLNSPYFCIHVGLSKSKNAMCFLSSNILVSARKTTSSISRADINLARPNWAENRPFSFDSHVAFIERRKVAKTTNLLHNFSLSKKAQLQQNWINIFRGEQKQSVLQRWVLRSVKRMVILTMCHISEFQNILECNYVRIGLSIHVKFGLGK